MEQDDVETVECPVCEGTGLDPMSLPAAGVPHPCAFCGGQGTVTPEDRKALTDTSRPGCLPALVLAVAGLFGRRG